MNGEVDFIVTRVKQFPFGLKIINNSNKSYEFLLENCIIITHDLRNLDKMVTIYVAFLSF